ncbi:cyanoexosortase C [Pantanalinema rosaneae CENA516]|uniref:cyanoexosortase C n=1 Tax=Pantanalinema rosaneae TaxID=1620701 RepID=UPI003D6DFC9D
MKWQKKVSQVARQFLQTHLKTTHGRFVLCGLLVGLSYLPVWLGGLTVSASQGSAGLPLILAVVFLGFHELWKQRQALAQTTAAEEDQLLGHILILSGVILFPFCRSVIWPQALIWLLVLAGIACSSWGVSFFRKYPLPILLIALSVYPKPGVMARILWQTFTPPNLLENLMANAGVHALRAIGQPATVIENVVSLPAGAVKVDWGCNGFNMAFTMAAAGLIMGLFLKQSWLKIIGFIVVGIVLSLLFNVPRIMLLAIASVYWGEVSFKFWHGPWGGQMFAGVLFTVYYYAIMWIVNRSTKKVPI